MAIDEIRSAYDALGNGDVEPLVSLMDERMEGQTSLMTSTVIGVSPSACGMTRGWPGAPSEDESAGSRMAAEAL